MKSVTYYIDKDKYGVMLCKTDRTNGNIISDTTKGEALGQLFAMFVNELDRMPNNTSIGITITRDYL